MASLPSHPFVQLHPIQTGYNHTQSLIGLDPRSFFFSMLELASKEVMSWDPRERKKGIESRNENQRIKDASDQERKAKRPDPSSDVSISNVSMYQCINVLIYYEHQKRVDSDLQSHTYRDTLLDRLSLDIGQDQPSQGLGGEGIRCRGPAVPYSFFHPSVKSAQVC